MIAVASDQRAWTITGPSELGSMCRNTIAPRLDAQRAGRQHVVAAPAAPASSRAAAGRRSAPGRRDGDDHRLAGLRASDGDDEREQQRRDRQHDVDDAHDERVDPAADRARRAVPSASPPARPNRRGEHADDQGLPAADEQPREQVAAAVVAAEQVAGLGPGHRVRSAGAPCRAAGRAGVVPGRDPRRDDREHDEHDDDRRADEEDRVAAQPLPRAARSARRPAPRRPCRPRRGASIRSWRRWPYDGRRRLGDPSGAGSVMALTSS